MDDGGYGKSTWIKMIAMLSSAVALVGLVVIDGALAHLIPSDGIKIGVQCGLAGTAIGLICLACATVRRKWRRTDVSRAPGSPQPEVHPDELRAHQEDILAAIESVRTRFDHPTIAMFTRMLTRPRYCLRVTERAELLGTSMRMHVTTDFVMSSKDRDRIAKSTSLPVPLLKISKGTMLDNLDVTDGADSSIPVLSQHEARGLVALALEALFYVTYEWQPFDTTVGAKQEAALWTLRRLVSRMGRLDNDLTDFDKAIGSLDQPSSERLAALRDFCSFFAVNYVVVADIPTPAGSRFIMKYSKTDALDIQNTLQNRLRARLGLVPYLFRVPLNLAFTAESYHFRMDIGDSQFVNDHYIADPDGHSISQEELRRLTGGGYVRVRSRSALPHAHLYARRLGNTPGPRDLVSVVKFAETPPGALGATTVVAAVSAALIAIMTFVAPSGNGPNADTSALLLAVPLFAATLVGHSIERMQRSSTGTYFGLLVTGAIAFLSATAFGLIPNKTSMENIDLFGFFMLPSVNIVGVVLSMIGVANAAFLWWRLRYQTERYLSRFIRPQGA
jgi:hypothetical protein